MGSDSFPLLPAAEEYSLCGDSYRDAREERVKQSDSSTYSFSSAAKP